MWCRGTDRSLTNDHRLNTMDNDRWLKNVHTKKNNREIEFSNFLKNFAEKKKSLGNKHNLAGKLWNKKHEKTIKKSSSFVYCLKNSTIIFLFCAFCVIFLYLLHLRVFFFGRINATIYNKDEFLISIVSKKEFQKRNGKMNKKNVCHFHVENLNFLKLIFKKNYFKKSTMK